MGIVALFVGDSVYNSDTKEYYILVILLPSLPGFQKHNSNAAYYSIKKICLYTVLQCFTEIFLHLLLVSINFPTIPHGDNSV
jgi:hypothetical protein